MPVFSTTIAGSEQEFRLGSFNVQEVANGVNTARFSVISLAGAYRPALGAEVIVTRDGVRVWGGYVEKTSESGANKQPLDDIETLVDSVSFNTIAERRFVYETIAAGSTLKQALQQLDDYVTPYGVTLSGSQADGPTLTTDIVFDGETFLAAIARLSQHTGYIGGIDYNKSLRMYAFGEIAAPFNVVDGDGNHVGDVQVDRSRGKYFNRVIVKYGTGILDKTDTFTGDGVEDTFPLNYRLIYQPQVGYGYVTNGATNYETLDLTGFGATWEYDPPTNSIIRVAGAPANLNAISITYPALFPALVTVEDASEISANGLFETVIEYPNVFDKDEAEALAATHLSQFLEILTTVKFDTYEHGLHPGQTITLTIADRNVSGSHLITEVKPVNPNNMQDLRYSVIAVDSETFRGSFRQLYRDWLAPGGSKTANIGNVDVSHGGGAPHPPQRAIQSFRDGQFYGASELLHDWDGGGDQHGVANIRSLLGITTNDDRHHLALINTTNGPAKAFTIQMIDGGDTLIAQDGGENVSLDVYGGGAISMASSQFTFAVDDYDVGYLRMRGLQQTVGLMPVCRRVTSAYTVDSTISGGGLPDFAVFGNGTFDITLPALASATVLSGTVYRRLLIIGNVGSGVVTINPDGSETINGAATLALDAGQHVVLQALTGTDAGWYTVGSHGIGGLTNHATTHESGGADPIQLDDLAAPSDNTDLDASTSLHGLLPKLSGDPDEFLDGTGNWSIPPGGGSPGSPSGSGSYELIEEQTPSGTGTITFSSLGAYTHLEIKWSARSTDAAANVNMGMTFNGDTGSNYDREQQGAVATTVTATEGIAATSALTGTLSAGGATSGLAGAGTICLYDVTGTTFQKAGTASNAYRTSTATGGTAVRMWGVGWRSTAAITSITLTLSAGNFVAGSKFSLYGIQ